MKKTLALVLALLMVLSLTACGGNGGNGGEGGNVGVNTEADYLDLTGNLPIIKDPAAFEEANGGKLKAFIINDAARTVEVKDLLMVQRWKEDTGIEFDWRVFSPKPTSRCTSRTPSTAPRACRLSVSMAST